MWCLRLKSEVSWGLHFIELGFKPMFFFVFDRFPIVFEDYVFGVLIYSMIFLDLKGSVYFARCFCSKYRENWFSKTVNSFSPTSKDLESNFYLSHGN